MCSENTFHSVIQISQQHICRRLNRFSGNTRESKKLRSWLTSLVRRRRRSRPVHRRMRRKNKCVRRNIIQVVTVYWIQHVALHKFWADVSHDAVRLSVADCSLSKVMRHLIKEINHSIFSEIKIKPWQRWSCRRCFLKLIANNYYKN